MPLTPTAVDGKAHTPVVKLIDDAVGDKKAEEDEHRAERMTGRSAE